MNEQLVDDSIVIPDGVLINKHYGQARLVIFFYTLLFLFYIITSTNYRSLDSSTILNLLGKVLFFGFIFYGNFKQLKNEKTNEKSVSMLGKWNGIVHLIFLVLLLIHSVNHFIEILAKNWYSFPTLVYFTIIISVSAICLLEFKYLKDLYRR